MSEAEARFPVEAGSGVWVFQGKLHRVQRGHGKAFVDRPPAQPPEPVRRPARTAVMLALAHKIQNAIDRGVVRDRAEGARKLGFSRARVTQILDLTLLAPDLQKELLDLMAVDGVEPIGEAAIRAAHATGLWSEQRASYESFCVRG